MESNYEKMNRAKQQIKYRLQNDNIDQFMYVDILHVGNNESANAMILAGSDFDVALMITHTIKANPSIAPLVASMLMDDTDVIEKSFNNYDFGGEVND